MNRAIMIAVKPIWCAKIMNGDKTTEVRTSKALYKATKKLIEEQGYATFLMYCTKGDVLEYLYDTSDNYGEYIDHKGKCWGDEQLNGKVLAKFTVRKVEEIENFIYYQNDGWCGEEREHIDTNGMCLSEDELHTYLKGKNGYAWHIEDLVIFDKPKELSEFKQIVKVHKCSTCCDYPCEEKCGFPAYVEFSKQLTKAPQNFCYVESEE